MTVASKNSVVVGYVGYFVGLSLLGLAIYCWSKPRIESAHPQAKAHETAHGTGAHVEYESVEGQDLEATAPPSDGTAPGADQGASTAEGQVPVADLPAATPPAAAGGDEWK